MFSIRIMKESLQQSLKVKSKHGKQIVFAHEKVYVGHSEKYLASTRILLKLFNLSNQNLIIYLSQLQARAAAAKVIKLILVISWSSSKLRFSLSNNCLLTIFGQKVRSKLLYYSKAPQTLKILFLEQLALLRLMADVFPRWHLNQPRHFFCLVREVLFTPLATLRNKELRLQIATLKQNVVFSPVTKYFPIRFPLQRWRSNSSDMFC